MNTVTKAENNRVAQNGGHEQRRYAAPSVNITETKDAYQLEAEMPGVSKDGLEVLLENNELTIVGHRGAYAPNAECLYRESRGFHFRRTFVLDPTIDTARINARMQDGVLFLSLPKAEKVKPRKIEITG
ncbi:MAG TPA: Hsp20/alpha crystallin family protein [Methylomirabilota bacterium]|nr:Hsp20/alpha crystallin family protein [Methylomirabilota bacterium]